MDAIFQLPVKAATLSWAAPTWASALRPILTPQQAADLLQVSKYDVYEWSSNGQLDGCKARVGKHLRLARDRYLRKLFAERLPRHFLAHAKPIVGLNATENCSYFTLQEIASFFLEPCWAARFPPVLTSVQAADLLQLSKQTIYDWSSRGLLDDCKARVGKHLRLPRDLFVLKAFNQGF
jgi:excisionase family DNA binding protein